MGAKYDYCAAFTSASSGATFGVLTAPTWSNVATAGFEAVWKRFGRPKTLSLQNYVLGTIDEKPYTERLLDEVVPPRASEIVFLYVEPRPIGALLAFHREGKYLLASASVEERSLDERLRLDLFEEIKMSLNAFRPCVLVAGEEALDVSEELIERVEGGEQGPIVQFGAELVVRFKR